jgi:hypothetical protein
MSDNAQIQNEQEISLLDLFTVLLRYRKLIIGITLVFIILAVAGYFIFPAYQYRNYLNNHLVQGRIIISIKQNMLNYITRNPEYFINRPDVIMDSLREAGMNEFEYAKNKTVSLTDEAERTRALYLINQIMIMNKNLKGKDKKEIDRIFQVNNNKKKDEKTVIRDDYTIEVIYKNKNAELIRSFLLRLVVHGNEIAGDYIRSSAEAIVNNYEQIMNGTHTGLSWEDAIGNNLFFYAYVKDFLDGKETILTALGEPVITEPDIDLSALHKDFFSKGVIIVLVGFIMAVILAFVLNAIRNIKNDEEAMKKIREAMGNSGEK